MTSTAVATSNMRARLDWQSLGRLLGTPLIPVVVAAVLGIYDIGTKSLWLDEGFSVAITRMPTSQLIPRLLFGELHGSPYYLVLHAWTWLGTSEAVVRSLSVVFGLVAVATTFYVGKRFGVGFAAALILAVSPFFVEYMQEGRAYTMLAACAALSTLLLLRTLEAPSLFRAALYVISAALIIYIQPLGALLICGHAVGVAANVAAPHRRRLLSMYVPIAIAWIPMVIYAALRTNRHISWIPVTDISDLIAVAISLAGGPILFGMVVAMLVLGFRRDMSAYWLLVPIGGWLAITFLLHPVMIARYGIAILPIAALILARNRAPLIAFLVIFSLIGVVNWYVNGAKADWRGASAWVNSSAQESDGVVFAPSYMRFVFGYYPQVAESLYPAAPWSQFEVSVDPTRAAASIEDRDRIWLVEEIGGTLPDKVVEALADLDVVETRDFAGSIKVSLLER